MRCLFPERVPVRENGRIVGYNVFSCGTCPACQETYKSDWALRVKHEMDCHEEAVYLTLTYDEVHLSLQNLEYSDGTLNSVQKREVQLFMKNFRRDIEPLIVRFIACGEYGEKFGRPHYHLLIFGISHFHEVFKDKIPCYKNGKLDHYYITKFSSWPHGFVEIDPDIPTPKVASYIAKYVAKSREHRNDKDYYSRALKHKEFLLMSRRPGIGFDGIMSHADFYLSHPYGVLGKSKVRLPRYIIDKVAEKTGTDFKELVQLNFSEFRKGQVNKIDTKNNILQKERNLNAKYKKK